MAAQDNSLRTISGILVIQLDSAKGQIVSILIERPLFRPGFGSTETFDGMQSCFSAGCRDKVPSRNNMGMTHRVVEVAG